MTGRATCLGLSAAWLALGLVAATAEPTGVTLATTSPAPLPEAAAPEPAGPAPERPDFVRMRDAVAAYRRGDLAAGDQIRTRVESPGAAAFLDWAALRLGGGAIPFDRVMEFTLAYPDYPNPSWLRRRGEEALLVERRPAAAVRAFFTRERPQTPAGKLALAQALRDDGLGQDAEALIRDAWRHDTFGAELEQRMLDAFKDTLTTADHRARMERAMLAEAWPAARRAAGYAGPSYDALLKARIAVDQKAKIAPKLIEAVPPALRSDTAYLFARVQNLRRTDKTGEAAQVLAEVTRDPEVLAGGDFWWVERRMVARKLLDDGEPARAYATASAHGAQSAEKRLEAEFMSGWIALRQLADPVRARRHFERVAALATSPPGQARAAYWLGRTAEAAAIPLEAKASYAAAARWPLTYYGQLAAARIGAADEGWRAPPPSAEAGARGPFVEAVALGLGAGLRELAVPLAVEFGRAGRDRAELDAVAAILGETGDARAMLALGKLATGRGLPLDDAAFPVSGIPAFEPVGRPPEPAMIHAIARQESAFDPAAGSGAGRARPDAADARHRARDRPQGGPDLRARPHPRGALQRGAGGRASRRPDGGLEGLADPDLRVLQRGRRQREEVDRGLWRPAKPRCRPGRLGRADPFLRDPQLRPAGNGEPRRVSPPLGAASPARDGTSGPQTTSAIVAAPDRPQLGPTKAAASGPTTADARAIREPGSGGQAGGAR